ncbi:MAG: hypothetical protein Q9173_002262 [Seirophora scorigena]
MTAVERTGLLHYTLPPALAVEVWPSTTCSIPLEATTVVDSANGLTVTDPAAPMKAGGDDSPASIPALIGPRGVMGPLRHQAVGRRRQGNGKDVDSVQRIAWKKPTSSGITVTISDGSGNLYSMHSKANFLTAAPLATLVESSANTIGTWKVRVCLKYDNDEPHRPKSTICVPSPGAGIRGWARYTQW